MLGVRELIVNVVSREIGHRLVNRETERLVCRAPRSRDGEREALSLSVGASVQPISERLGEVNRTRTGPVQAKRSIGHFIEEIQVLNRCVVDAKGRADAGLAGSAKDLTQDSVAETRRIGNADARSEVVISGRGQGLGNAWIARIYETLVENSERPLIALP